MSEFANKCAIDVSHMRRALALARRGSGLACPNPVVGAVVVRNGAVVGRGWHREASGAHAEVEALDMSGALAQGATLYVTLEPCNHYGKTPPCVERIVAAGVARVVLAMRDPNPHVKGGGIERLRAAGIEVVEGILSKEAQALNRPWLSWIQNRRPLVVVKLAVSLDGRIAHADGRSKWLSSTVSRAQVHRLRRETGAIMVGVSTVMADNPRLTNRTGYGAQPLRVIVDSQLRVPPSAEVFRPLGLREQGPNPIAIVATTSRSDYQQRRDLEMAGAEVVVFDGPEGRVDLSALFSFLGARGIQSVLCEGGAKLATELLCKGLCHQLMLYSSPLLIGKAGEPFYAADQAIARQLALRLTRRVGPDVLSVYDILSQS